MYNLKAYTNIKFTPNHMIEYLSSYLSGRELAIFKDNSSSYSLSVCRGYEENKKELNIRVEVSSDMVGQLDRLNYLSIGSKYYFVTGFTKLSDYIVELNLQLDVVNSFQTMIKDSTFKNVKMKRRMKDRWALYNQTYYRIYDKCDEGLGNVATQVEFNENVTSENCYIVNRTIEDSDDLHLPFAMNLNKIYTDNAKPYVAYSNRFLDESKFKYYMEGNKLIYRVLIYCEDATGLISVNLKYLGKDKYVLANAIHVRAISANSIVAYLGSYSNEVFTPITEIDIGITQQLAYLQLESIFGTQEVVVESQKITGADEGVLTLGKNYSKSEIISPDTTSSSALLAKSVDIPSISIVSRNDSQIQSITDVPFVPFVDSIFWMGDNIGIITSGMLWNAFSLDLNASSTEPRHYTKNLNKIVMTRNKVNESKLYGSYVRDHQIVYDTFALPVQPEYYNGYIQSLSTTIYKPLEMSNDLAFKCTSLIQQSLNSNVMSCTRNNNLVVYSNEYLNYLRNGYNYDEKSQSLNRIKTTMGTIQSLAGVGLNVASKSAMGGIGAYGAVQSTMSAVNTITSSIFANIENDRALEEKRQQLINTSPTMSGSTSIDLFKEINGGNCLKYVTTRPSDAVLESIWNLFYFYGYADNTTQATLKLSQTREYFDYYQGDAENMIYSAYIDNVTRSYILEALSQGITIEHYYNKTWLCEGTLYENWETSI